MLTRSIFDSPLATFAEMDRLFDTMVGGAPLPMPVAGARSRMLFPALNIYEDEANVYAEAELPGFSLGDLDVSIAGDELTIRGKRQLNLPEGATSLRRERLAGEFERTIALPVEIDVERVEATLANGVLLITLPKSRSAQARKIEVRAAGETS